jgi:hypothetical protein
MTGAIVGEEARACGLTSTFGCSSGFVSQLQAEGSTPCASTAAATLGSGLEFDMTTSPVIVSLIDGLTAISRDMFLTTPAGEMERVPLR